MLTLRIVGQGTLAETVRTCCAPYFAEASPPDLLWVCYDTPIKPNGGPEVGWVRDRIAEDLADLPASTRVLVSSQIPVGTIARLQAAHPAFRFAYSPENIRVAHGVADFKNQRRVLVGRRNHHDDALWQTLFRPFTDHLILTDPETAELAKHALNAYLGLSIAFINEIARLAPKVGADVEVIAKSLLTERRVSADAPLNPGPPFGGGHLMRDIQVLSELSERLGIWMPLVQHILPSNVSLTVR